MSEQMDLTAMVLEMQEKGVDEKIIEAFLNQEIQKNEAAAAAPGQEGLVSDRVATAFQEYDPKKAFKDAPPKPKNFERRQEVAKFTPVFPLESKQVYVLNGEERKVKILNTKDFIRLTSRLRGWLSYVGYNVPDMLVDEISGQYRTTETLLKVIERVFSDWDEELDRPTDFALSVLQEVAYLLDLEKDHTPAEDYLLSCNPDEVFEAIKKLIGCNQDFFIKLWNNSGPIREIFSLTSGMISNYTRPMKESLDALKNALSRIDSAS